MYHQVKRFHKCEDYLFCKANYRSPESAIIEHGTRVIHPKIKIVKHQKVFHVNYFQIASEIEKNLSVNFTG